MTAAVDNKTLHFFLFIFSVPFYFVCFSFFSSFLSKLHSCTSNWKSPCSQGNKAPPGLPDSLHASAQGCPNRHVTSSAKEDTQRGIATSYRQGAWGWGFPTPPPLPPNFIASHSFLTLSLNNYPMPRPEQKS